PRGAGRGRRFSAAAAEKSVEKRGRGAVRARQFGASSELQRFLCSRRNPLIRNVLRERSAELQGLAAPDTRRDFRSCRKLPDGASLMPWDGGVCRPLRGAHVNWAMGR